MIFVNGNENVNTYVTNYTSVFRNFYFFTIKTNNCISPTRSIVYQLNWYVNGWVPAVVSGVASLFTNGIAIDNSGNTYSSDSNGGRIIKTTSTGVSSVLLAITGPFGLAINSNILYISRSSPNIGRYDLATSTLLSDITIAAIPPAPGVGIRALTFDSQNNMYAQNAEGTNAGDIYKRTPDGTITQILVQTGNPCGTSMGYYRDSANDEYIYYTQTLTRVVNRTRVLVNGSVPPSFVKQPVAGNGAAGDNPYSGDGGLAINANIKAARGVAVDTLGNVIVMDNENSLIHYIVASTGIIRTICGTGIDGLGRNGDVGTSSNVSNPWAVVFKDPSTAYFTDSANTTVRVLNLTGHY